MVRSPLSSTEVQRGERLGALLRQARGERSMVDVALAAGISPETLRKIETGRIATPSFPTIAAVTTVLSLSLDQVWAEIDAPPHQSFIMSCIHTECEPEQEPDTNG